MATIVMSAVEKKRFKIKDDAIPCILEPDGSSGEFRKNWAHLIQKIYEIDPLTCPKCSGAMKVISVIENEDVIKKILKHLGLWEKEARSPPMKEKAPGIIETTMDYSLSQLPHWKTISILMWNILSKIPTSEGRPHSENSKNNNSG